jgi:hypothetical protein
MSNLSTPEPTALDASNLETVTGGAAVATRCANSDLTQTLSTLQSTISNLSTNNTNNGSLTMPEVMMFGMMMSQRSQVNVFVRRPYW